MGSAGSVEHFMLWSGCWHCWCCASVWLQVSSKNYVRSCLWPQWDPIYYLFLYHRSGWTPSKQSWWNIWLNVSDRMWHWLNVVCIVLNITEVKMLCKMIPFSLLFFSINSFWKPLLSTRKRTGRENYKQVVLIQIKHFHTDWLFKNTLKGFVPLPVGNATQF